jgi:hypothetical protein
MTNNDMISRKAVEEMIKAEMPERGMWEIGGNAGDIEKQTVCEVCVDLLQSLNELPSVTPKSSEDMPCITPEEMQKCKDIVKKYTPKQQRDDAISRQYLLDNCVVDKVTMPYVPVSKIENEYNFNATWWNASYQKGGK